MANSFALSPFLSLSACSICHVPRLYCAKSGSKVSFWTTPRALRVCVCVFPLRICVCLPFPKEQQKEKQLQWRRVNGPERLRRVPRWVPVPLSMCVSTVLRGRLTKRRPFPFPLLDTLPRGTGQSLFTFWLYLFVLMFFGYYQDHLIYN